ncbi:hypothetical protein [Hoeflea sp.]|uniref:hypothetical protein n=1 Tax=Hoeflea sp. TaxID=1940281 RepID=UPI003A91CC2D
MKEFFPHICSLDCSNMPCPLAGMPALPFKEIHLSENLHASFQGDAAAFAHSIGRAALQANLPLTQQKNRNPGVTVFAISHIRLAIHARPGSWGLSLAVQG